MTDRLDQLIAERLSEVAGPTEEGDWLDVVRRSRDGRPARRLVQGRRVVVLAAGLAVLLALAAGAGALTDTQTGVPAIDRFLDSVPSQPTPSDAPESPGATAPPPFPNFELAPGTPQAQLRAANPGGPDWVVLAFEKSAGEGRFCLLAAADSELGRPRGGAGCVNRNVLGGGLDSGGALVSVTNLSASRVLVSGLTFADATRVEVRTDRDRQAAKLSEVFTETRFSSRVAPHAADGSPRRDRVGLRAFVAIVSAAELPDLPPGQLIRKLLSRPRARVVTTLSDGRQLIAKPGLGGL